MNNDLDQAIKSAVSDIVAAAPDITHDPAVVMSMRTAEQAPRRLLLAAATVLVVAVGVAGVALARRGGSSQTSPPAAEQPAGATVTELDPRPTAPATTVAAGQACSTGTGETVVPNVAGEDYQVAIDTLNAAGVGFEVVREASPGEGGSSDVGLVIARQDPTPGAAVACGDVVVLMATHKSRALYTTQPGDTWESIAIAQSILVDDLLGANGLTLAALEATGETVASPLDAGRVVTLLLTPSLDSAPPTTG